MSARFRTGSALAMIGAALVVGAAVLAWRDDATAQGATGDRWMQVFDGYGTVSADAQQVSLRPAPPLDIGTTHAALVVAHGTTGDIRLQATVTTHRQLRAGAPNPWEVGWVLWHYSDPAHFYAVALKPNGWEISKQDPAYPGGQRFLASGTRPGFAVGVAHTLQVTQRGRVITVVGDGVALATVTDNERPYMHGVLGLYTEDADVDFTNISAGDLE